MTTKDDRALLEAAAKAAGVPAYWSDDGTIQQRPILVVKAGGGMGTMPYESEWNPLRDNDAAFYLQVKLRINVVHFPFDVAAMLPDLGKSWAERYDADPYAATRRAIVRAAASMAKEGE